MNKVLAYLMAGIAVFCLFGVRGASVQAATNLTGRPDLGLEYPQAANLTDTDPRLIVARIIRIAMGVLGLVATVIILYAGFLWMTAGGNEEKAGEAKKWIYFGVIGLAIILSAYALSNFVVTQLLNATTMGDSTTY